MCRGIGRTRTCIEEKKLFLGDLGLTDKNVLAFYLAANQTLAMKGE